MAPMPSAHNNAVKTKVLNQPYPKYKPTNNWIINIKKMHNKIDDHQISAANGKQQVPIQIWVNQKTVALSSICEL